MIPAQTVLCKHERSEHRDWNKNDDYGMDEDKRLGQCDFNASTGAITAPVTGNYLVSGNIVFGAMVRAIGNIFQVNIVANSVIVAFQCRASCRDVCRVSRDSSNGGFDDSGSTLVLEANQITGSVHVLSLLAGLL